MTRTPTSSPLVERDADGSLVPAGRQMATHPPRTDDRSSYGLTDVEEVIFQYAADEVNGLHSRVDQYVTIEEEKAMQALNPPLTSMDARAAFLTDYREKHPLPTSYSALPSGDPSLYVPPTIASAPIVLTPISGGIVPPVVAPTMSELIARGLARPVTITQPVAPPVTPAPIVLPTLTAHPDTHAAILASALTTVLTIATDVIASMPQAGPPDTQHAMANAVLDGLAPSATPEQQDFITILRFALSRIHMSRKAA